jgi:hypothetical protein
MCRPKIGLRVVEKVVNELWRVLFNLCRWHMQIEFYRHGGVAGAKTAQSLSGTVFFKDGRTTGLKGNLIGPAVLLAPPFPSSPPPPKETGPSKTPPGK